MTGLEIGFIGLGLLFALLALRVPIGVSLILVSFGGLWAIIGWRPAWGAIGVMPYHFSANWVLSSVPMFLLMGYISFHAKLTEGLFEAARAWLGGLPGGLAISSIFGAAGFAAASGSSLACSAAMGRIAIPEMLKSRYSAELATGTVAAAGTIGALIPPSIIMILYGVMSQTSVPALFLGGISVGLLTAVAYILVVYLRVKINPSLAPAVTNDVTMAYRFAVLKKCGPILLVMIGIFGGLFGGLFTATEAGAIGAALACVIGLAQRTLNWERFKVAAMECLMTTSALIIIGVGATLFTRFLALSGVGNAISAGVIGLSDDPLMILFLIVLVYLLLGCFLEPIGAMLLTLPIVLPIIKAGNYDMVWFGVLLTKLLEIGMLTPPIGMNVFVVKSVVGNQVAISTIFKGVAWFLAADLLIVVCMIFYPDFVLYLPRLFG